jgi:hypothetical protein
VALGDWTYDDEPGEGDAGEDQDLPRDVDIKHAGHGGARGTGGKHDEDQREAEHLRDDEDPRRDSPPNPGVHT